MTGAGDFLAERIGLRLDGVATARLERVVREGAQRAGCPEARYGRLLAEDPERAQELVDGVTVQESSFFRHPEQFAFLAEHLRGQPATGVIWSAGCGNGQEPWSLAMLLEELGLRGWTVLASDVSMAALERARVGEYPERQLRGLDPARRGRFIRDGRVTPRLRPRVRFEQHNLVTDDPPPGAARCRVVLCRNVLIYLHPAASERLLERLRERMLQDAVLLVGSGEAVGAMDGFRAGPVPGVFLREPFAAVPDEMHQTPYPPLALMLAEGARLAASGRLEAAADCYRRAGFLEPGDPRPRARLAAVLDRIGETR